MELVGGLKSCASGPYSVRSATEYPGLNLGKKMSYCSVCLPKLNNLKQEGGEDLDKTINIHMNIGESGSQGVEYEYVQVPS